MTTKHEGPSSYEHPALTEARRAASLPKRKADEGDHVPATKLPMTVAQRIARDLKRDNR